MRKVWYGCALVGVAIVSSGVTAAVLPTKTVVKFAAAPARTASAKPHHVRIKVPKRVTGSVTRRAPKPKRIEPSATPIGSAVSPSLYERTISPVILRAQGCRAGRQYTRGLVVLDFGKSTYRPRRGGYGTLTFADRFASDSAVGWAVKAYAHGYSECLPKGAHAKITLALGTSNYGLRDVPSTYEAGKAWAREVASIGAYLRLHHFDHVTAAAGDDVEPAWDRGFQRTYDFFRGFRDGKSGHLIYNYGSLDGGVVRGIWKLRQAYYVAGGMEAARAVPEIYNRAMAIEWAELVHLSTKKYGKPIKLVGLMTQHHGHCRFCGYTSAQAHRALVHELRKKHTTKKVVRYLASTTNIGAPAPVSNADLPRR